MTGRHLSGSLGCMLVALFVAGTAAAGTVDVRVVDVDGQPVPEVAVFIKQAGIAATANQSPTAAVMDQRDVQFVPHILIVQKGAWVEFPNSDVIAHHVYSFSRPNNFVLPLYKGTPPAPVHFIHDGVVTLGCNIHDDMLGYIVVVDTSVFGMTDAEGTVKLSVDDNASSYQVNIWSPRIRDASGPLVQNITSLPAGGVKFELQKSLRSPHAGESESVQWDEY
jgi:plastocyanin